MKMRLPSLVPCLLVGCMCSAVEFPRAVSFNDDGSFRIGQTQVGVRIVPTSGWSAQFRNAAFKIVRKRNESARRTLVAELPVGDGVAEQEIVVKADGSVSLDFSASFTNRMTFTAAFFEIRMPSELKGIEIDGKPFQFPQKSAKAGLGSFRHVRSFSIMSLDGTKATFTGPFPMSIQDSRVFGENWFEIRIPLQRKGERTTELTREFTFTCEPTGKNGVDFFRWGKGLPVYRDPVFREGPEWVKVDFARETKPGSPLDFTFLQDAPAGKYGFLKRGEDGHGTFERSPGSRPRFYGGNFAWDSSLLEKDETARVAAELPRLGYNLVRAHQHDTKFLPKGAKDSAALDPAVLDRWDWFVYCMKSNGVYFTTDCYSSRVFLKSDAGLEKYAGTMRAMKDALLETPAALANWKLFTRRLLTHVNPYTGLSLADEPAMICLNLVNEENRPDAKRQMDIHREQLRFLREDLKVKCLLTSLNHRSEPDLVVRRSLFDVVDLHMYFSHPNRDGKGRTWFGDVFKSQLIGIWPGGIWRRQFPSRLWDRPVLTTEFRHCWPNVFRCEAGPMIGAYGSFQDWDALVGYGYAEGAASLHERNYNSNPFDTCNDPFSLFGEKISILMFRRGDVRPAEHRVCVTVPRGLVDRPEAKRPKSFPEPVCSLGLLTGIGSAVETAPEGMTTLSLAAAEAPKGLAGDLLKAATNGVWRGDTGETVLDTNEQTLLVSTPKSESCTVAEGCLAGRFLKVSEVRHPTTVSAHALDGKPLAESHSVLVFHLTDSANDGESFTDLTMRYPVSRGKGPMLVRRDAVRVEFQRKFRVQALKCDGSVAGELANNGSCVTLRTDAFPGAVLAYHLTR